ncbi:hypothetical protein HK405_014672, partial [Cladochytrium tenue]
MPVASGGGGAAFELPSLMPDPAAAGSSQPPPPRPAFASLASLPLPVLERIFAFLRVSESRHPPQPDVTDPSNPLAATSTADATVSVSPPGDGSSSPRRIPASVACLSVCRQVSKAAARAVYFHPPLASATSMLALLSACLAPIPPMHPYALLVRHLDLSTAVLADLDLGDVDIALQLFPNLSVLKVGPSPIVTNVLLQSVVDHLGTAAATAVSPLPSPSSPFGSPVAAVASSLRRLEVRGCPVSDVMLDTLLSGCSNLRWLDLSETDVTVGAVISAAIARSGHLSTLRLVDVGGPAGGPDDFIAPEPSARLLHDGPPLAHVDLSRSISTTDRAVRLLVDSCKESLRSLVLSGCANLTDDSICRVGRLCRRLRALDISFMPWITDLSLYALGTAPPPPSLALDVYDELEHPKAAGGVLPPKSAAPCLEFLNISA